MPRKVHVHCLEPGVIFVAAHTTLLQRCLENELGTNGLTDDPRKADTILLVPSFRPMFHWYRRHLLDDSVVMQHLPRCFVLESSDGPADYLRGCYVAMPAERYSRSRHRPIGFLRGGDSSEGPGLQTTTPLRLYCFRGAESHPLRLTIVQCLGERPEGVVSLMDRWLNYTEAEHRAFWRELGEAKFVLCPRGLGTSSIRVQETMQAGRVPVIISDEWVPPAGPKWPEFSVRIAENRVGDIPAVLARREDDAAEMGRLARREWERFYDPRGAYARWLLTLIDEVATEDANWSAAAEVKRWGSADFRWSHGFDPLHRTLNRARRAKQSIARTARIARR